jgi:hypothetical protein
VSTELDELAGIYRIDPASGWIAGTTEINRGRLRMSVGTPVVAAGAVWAIGAWARPHPDFDRTEYVTTNRWGLVRLDPATGKPTDVAPTGRNAVLVRGPGGPWLLRGRSLQSVRWTDRGLDVRPFGHLPGRFLAFEAGAVVVRTEDGTVRRLTLGSLNGSARPRSG